MSDIRVIKKREGNSVDQPVETVNLKTKPKKAADVVKDWITEWRRSKETQNDALWKTWTVSVRKNDLS